MYSLLTFIIKYYNFFQNLWIFPLHTNKSSEINDTNRETPSDMCATWWCSFVRHKLYWQILRSTDKYSRQTWRAHVVPRAKQIPAGRYFGLIFGNLLFKYILINSGNCLKQFKFDILVLWVTSIKLHLGTTSRSIFSI